MATEVTLVLLAVIAGLVFLLLRQCHPRRPVTDKTNPIDIEEFERHSRDVEQRIHNLNTAASVRFRERH